jgi:nucleoside-triphosphatase THEP1
MLLAMTKVHSIAIIETRDKRDLQLVLSQAVASLSAEGVRVAGTLAEDSEIEGTCSAGYLRDIVTGRRFSIQLGTAPVGTKCHLDAFGIESACDLLLPELAAADLVVLSKFGKLEAMEHGLWRAFSIAARAGTPLLTTVSSRHSDAWQAWAPAVTRLEASVPAIEAWWRALNRPILDREPPSFAASRDP